MKRRRGSRRPGRASAGRPPSTATWYPSGGSRAVTPRASIHDPGSRTPLPASAANAASVAAAGSSRTSWNSPVIRPRRCASPAALEAATAAAVKQVAPSTATVSQAGPRPAPAPPERPGPTVISAGTTVNSTAASSADATVWVSSGPSSARSSPSSVTSVWETPRANTIASMPAQVCSATNSPRATGPRARAARTPVAVPTTSVPALPASTATVERGSRLASGPVMTARRFG